MDTGYYGAADATVSSCEDNSAFRRHTVDLRWNCGASIEKEGEEKKETWELMDMFAYLCFFNQEVLLITKALFKLSYRRESC